jgi:hypothetical protein
MIYEFKITLDDTKPTVWRLIQVPDTFTFRDLHRKLTFFDYNFYKLFFKIILYKFIIYFFEQKDAIQDAMGWNRAHLHVFRIYDQNSKLLPEEIEIGPKDVYIGFCQIDDTDAKISKYFKVAVFIFFIIKLNLRIDFFIKVSETDRAEKTVSQFAEYEYDMGDGQY